MPPAARVTDMHTCPMVTGVVPHVGGPILPPGVPTVLIGFLPAATVTNLLTCVGPPDTIIKGSAGVMINFLPAARLGDSTAHGGVIILGCPTVIIGEVGAPSPGAGGLGAIVAGLAMSGANTPLTHTPQKLSVASAQLDAMFAQAPAAAAQVNHAAADVAAQHGGTAAPSAPPSKEAAMQQAMDDHDGDASQIDNLVGSTIIVPAGNEAAALQTLTDAAGNAVQAVHVLDADADPSGAGSAEVVLKTPAGLLATIVITSPEMVYASEDPAVARAMLPPKDLKRLEGREHLPEPGRGKALQKKAKSLALHSPESEAANAESREYYKKFRAPDKST